ncbi:hypothetical protein JK358_31310 [Nocardia sp. 2]|uniref:BNR/Asp-box repeat protein n=1 Tax=Nocardia acididurans TaxID=2802282 RepID=A0ABS1ME57_9NOCA|nr:hypothetical protein [Nocardia acididurans]MBL1078902.1 hypothetical protein [Nocardia acididurans]
MSVWSRAVRYAATALLLVGTAGCGWWSTDARSQFHPLWVEFISDTEGWTAGYWHNGCAPGCPKLLHTLDGGRTWTAVAEPPVGESRPVIADARNWYVTANTRSPDSDPAELWVTHDAGLHWARVALPAEVEQAQWTPPIVVDSTVRISVFDARTGEAWILSSPVEVDEFTLSPPFPTGLGDPASARQRSYSAHLEEAYAGPVTWIGVSFSTTDRPSAAQGARLVDGVWSAWRLPCSGMGLPELQAISPTDLLASCVPADGTYSQQRHLYTSVDGGDTFTDLGPIVPDGRPATLIGAATTQDLIAAAMTGDPDRPYAVRTSHDGGRAWTTTLDPEGALPTSYYNLPDTGGFFTPTLGFATVPFRQNSDTIRRFYLTRDAGNTWTPFIIDIDAVTVPAS